MRYNKQFMNATYGNPGNFINLYNVLYKKLFKLIHDYNINNCRIIWKTINAVYPEYSENDRTPSEYRLYLMNKESNELANKYGFMILDDYIISHSNPKDYYGWKRLHRNRYGDKGDPIHYNPNGFTMKNVLKILKHLICL